MLDIADDFDAKRRKANASLAKFAGTALSAASSAEYPPLVRHYSGSSQAVVVQMVASWQCTASFILNINNLNFWGVSFPLTASGKEQMLVAVNSLFS